MKLETDQKIKEQKIVTEIVFTLTQVITFSQNVLGYCRYSLKI